MNNDIFITDILKEMSVSYNIDKEKAYQITIESITKVYKSDYPVVLEKDGIYAVFNSKAGSKEKLKFVKIVYSAKKKSIILNMIKDEVNQLFLKRQANFIIDFIKNIKGYLHASYSHSDSKYDYYDLYTDIKHKNIVKSVKAASNIKKIKKTRIYINFNSYRNEKNIIIFKEYKKFVNIKNLKEFFRDISNEVFLKTQKKVWIELQELSYMTKTVFIHLPFITTKEIIEYIQNRIYEIFRLNAIIYYKKESV